MENIILVKKLVEDVEEYKTMGCSDVNIDKTYLDENNDCFRGVLTKNSTACSDASINDIRREIGYLIQGLLKTKDGFLVVSELYNMLKETTTKEDLIEITKNLISKYYDSFTISSEQRKTISLLENSYNLLNDNDNKLKEKREVKLEFLLSTVIKTIVVTYYKSLLSQDKKKLNSLIEMKFNGASDCDLLENLGEKFSETSKKNGMKNLSASIVSGVVEKLYLDSFKHLCSNCKNASPLKCPKIEDVFVNKEEKINGLSPKKIFTQGYPFVVEGFEVITSNNEGQPIVDSCVVSRCINYEEEPDRQTSVKRTRKALAKLACLRFGAEDMDEVNGILDQMLKSGQIVRTKRILK